MHDSNGSALVIHNQKSCDTVCLEKSHSNSRHRLLTHSFGLSRHEIFHNHGAKASIEMAGEVAISNNSLQSSRVVHDSNAAKALSRKLLHGVDYRNTHPNQRELLARVHQIANTS